MYLERTNSIYSIYLFVLERIDCGAPFYNTWLSYQFHGKTLLVSGRTKLPQKDDWTSSVLAFQKEKEKKRQRSSQSKLPNVNLAQEIEKWKMKQEE
jgi:hypothetical protein